MKKSLFSLLAVYVLITAFAQNNLIAQADNYYWADKDRIELTPSSTHFIITANDASLLTQTQPKNVKKYESWEHKSYAVVEVSDDITIPELIVNLGFDTDEVQISPGFALSDGFIIYPTQTIVAQLLDDNNASEMIRLVNQFGVKNITEKFGTYRIELKSLHQVLAAANTLHESRLFQFVQPDFYAPIERYQINDPLFSQQFQMNNTGQTLDGVTGANDADCNALEAWGISLGSSSTTVAVIDDGMEDHEDFNNSSGQSRYTAGFSPANNGNGDAVSGSNHGVACAGSISASHNNIGVRGVAPLANMISVNIFVGGESTQDIADGITWAKNAGADVMSNSWGYTSCTVNFSNINNAMADANANGRGGLGCVIVFASGNGYKSCVDYPANNTNVIAVGAFANTGVRSAYSNYGSALDIMAPSNNVGGPGAGVRTTDRMGGPGYTSSNYTSSFGGTSSACPVVAGVATLLLGYDASLTSTEVKNILYTTAIDMGASGFDNQYANGRVNALGALQAVGGGGGGGGSCSDNELTLTINLDNYPGETTWDVQTSGGSVLASGGSYSGAGSTVTEDLCIPDGCELVFTIYDSYGDGICCGYGNGSYSLSGPNGTIASGGAFNSSESTTFDLGSGCGGGGSCTEIDFSSYTVNSYGGSQDNGTSSLYNGGQGVIINGNAWKSIALDYTITPNTVIEFDFGSTSQGEIHGIGFDNNSGISSGFTFQLYGTQNWGNRDFDYTSPGSWQSFVIPIGSYYTGSFDRLFFVNDKDSGTANNNSYFRNIKIHEGGGCGSSFAGGVQNLMIAQNNTTLTDFNVYPNPTRGELNVDFNMEFGQTASIRVFNMMGQVIELRQVEADGFVSEQFDTFDLPAGTYIVQIDLGTQRLMKKFNVIH